MAEKKIRVLLICLTRRGGLLHYNDCLAESLSRICDVKLLCAENAEHAQALQQVDMQTIDTGKGAKGTVTKLFSPATWKTIRKISDDFRPDVIHITSAQEWNPALGLFIRHSLKKPLIYTIHDVIHHEGTPFYFKITEGLFRGMPDGFSVLTEQGKNILSQRGVSPEKILVTPHGVYDFFTQYRRDIPEQKEILFFGRIEPYKGMGVLLEAARPLLDENPDWTLQIAGGGDVTPYQELLSHPQIKLTNRFLSDAEVDEFMERASIVALPYLSASQSGVIPTAFAFGKAVAATAVGGIPDMVRDHETGLLVPPNDVPALREALRELISDPKLREKIGKAGRAYALSELSWDSIAAKHAAFYHKYTHGVQP
ncbi:MAG: glycosyltransferase family 4 protein [Anaerolineaceae bacterium]|nr:glycosyltransferase family 4 protein [Anaerolineaceae bacterium]